MLCKAISIAAKAHDGQFDKGGQPYILHPLRVMLHFEEEDYQICAILHDVVEDTEITLDFLRKEGFSQTVLSTLQLLTRQPNDDYTTYINRILTNPIACNIKLWDLKDNLSKDRIKNPTNKDIQRWEKYENAKNKIEEQLLVKKKPI